MTVKEFNRIRHAAYTAAAEIEEVYDAFKYNNTVYIYEAREGEKHKIFALAGRLETTRLDLLRREGFTDNVCVKLIMTLDHAAQSARFF